MRAGTRGALQVGFQDGRPLADGNVFELDLLALAAAQDCFAARGADVLDPTDVFAEHGDEVALAVDDGDDYRERERAAGGAAGDFQGREIAGSGAEQARGGHDAVGDAGDPVGTVVAVEPAGESV